jgi:hypothetical protein
VGRAWPKQLGLGFNKINQQLLLSILAKSKQFNNKILYFLTSRSRAPWAGLPSPCCCSCCTCCAAECTRWRAYARPTGTCCACSRCDAAAALSQGLANGGGTRCSVALGPRLSRPRSAARTRAWEGEKSDKKKRKEKKRKEKKRKEKKRKEKKRKEKRVAREGSRSQLTRTEGDFHAEVIFGAAARASATRHGPSVACGARCSTRRLLRPW